MKKISKSRKVIISGFLVVLLVIIVLGIICIITSNTFIFEHETHYLAGMYNAEEYENLDELKSEEYIIKYPDFHNSTFHIGPFLEFGSFDKNTAIYTEMSCKMMDYAYEVAEQYDNYAKLDYTVIVDENKTVTIHFYGCGCFYDNREPEMLDKTFVYDISNVSVNNPPRLISEE